MVYKWTPEKDSPSMRRNVDGPCPRAPGPCFCDGACKRNVPVILPLPDDYDPNDTNPVVAICGECGLRIHRVMGYSCSNPRCPTGMGPVIC